jgi:hypothetical protein
VSGDGLTGNVVVTPGISQPRTAALMQIKGPTRQRHDTPARSVRVAHLTIPDELLHIHAAIRLRSWVTCPPIIHTVIGTHTSSATERKHRLQIGMVSSKTESLVMQTKI